MDKRKLSVDILKAVCAVQVILLHTIYGNWYDKLRMVFWAQMAVPIFMILSGYTYTSSIRKKEIIGSIQWFSFDNMAPKIRRILIPYSMMFYCRSHFASTYEIRKNELYFCIFDRRMGARSILYTATFSVVADFSNFVSYISA